ncbi:molybdenum cofactor guanylyltransferase [Roseibium aquae]|uniref:Molybdenum cofactor guanylyltransferase n=1 Tax=Roseibium aquae TaxID=1323746 RepID=A0A916TEJ9_9HYPH|nr:molybdenum cofactor guanylyltransferase MobA [Roseibium aquae]GGB41903.1 molybdenum cofactor guanylyltransferase [Roseibium aquae]
MKVSQSKILACVLAGGQSRRMGGGDKPLLDLGGRPMLSVILDRLTPQVDHVILNANGDPNRFKAFQLPVVPDPVGDFAGPLAGILAGMTYARDALPDVTHVVSVAGDTPFFPENLVKRLAKSVPFDKPVIALASSHDKLHPVFGLWPVQICDDLKSYLEKGESGKVLAFVDRYDSVEVAFDKETEHGLDPFFNANRPDDLERARQVLQKKTA